MSLDRSLISRFAVPQTSAEWEQLFARCLAAFAKVPANRWQFALTLLLVFALSVSLARLFWLVFPAPVLPPAAIALPMVTNHVANDGQSINIAQLKALPVFGKYVPPAAKQETPAVIENQAVDTHLNLVLVGIIGSNDEKASRAVIASGEKQDVYAIGDALPVGNGVTLSKVMADRVIINNNGQYESLWLYSNDPNAKAISQASYVPPPPPPASPERPWASGRPSAMGPEMQMPRPDQGGDPVAEVSRNLSDVLAMSIYRENGQVVGYKIRPGRDAEKFKSLGLQTDDVVTSVNGMPLTNPAKIMEVYKNMGNATSASLEIKRGGSVITVDVVLQN
jgi:general secretion pathway protein C